MIPDNLLEETAAWIAREQEADGVIIIIITPGNRAEVIAALTDPLTEVAPGTLLHRVADELEAGGGIPVGRHLQKL